jgi:small subunit ribosomal protein S20
LANIKSAEKKARQAVVRNARNQAVKSTVRTAEKNLRDAAISTDKSKVAELFKTFSSRITRAAQKGVIPRTTASRKIGRMATFIGSK